MLSIEWRRSPVNISIFIMDDKIQIPRLETPQTAHIRASYPTIEYLENGYIADWLKERQDQLLELAREERSGINANKLISGAVLTAGFFLHALSPLAPVGVVFGLVGYVHGCFIDANRTGSFSPFPFIRGNVLDLAGKVGNAELRETVIDDATEFDQLQHYLSIRERKEYEFINVHFALLTDYLSQLESLKRFHAYRWIFDSFLQFKGALPTKEQVSAHMVNVAPDLRNNSEHLQALDQRRLNLETKTDNKVKFIEQQPVKYITDKELYNPDEDNTIIHSPQQYVKKTEPVKTSTTNNYQWVDQVLKMPFRVLTGDAGSGKSTLERFMISKLKDAGYHIVCINTETNPDVWKGVEVLTTPNDINDFLSEFVSGIENRQRECRKLGIDEDEFLSKVAANRTGRDGRVAIFFMEANTFELCGVDPDLWASVLQMCLTNIRKWGYSACLTAQSDTQTSISSKMKGFSSRYDEQPRVECIVKTDEITGEAVSSGRAWLKIKGKSDKNAKTINLANFPKTKDFRTNDEKKDTVPVAQTNSNQRDNLNDVIQSLEKSLVINTEKPAKKNKTVNDTPLALPKLSVADMIAKIENTRSKSLEQFITYDLSALSYMAKLKPAIVKIIRERVELLEKFSLKWLSIDDPIEAMVMWGAGNKSDDELKEAWLLHTEKELNDEGVKLLRGKLG